MWIGYFRKCNKYFKKYVIALTLIRKCGILCMIFYLIFCRIFLCCRSFRSVRVRAGTDYLCSLGVMTGGGLAVTAGFSSSSSLSRGGLVACVHSIHTVYCVHSIHTSTLKPSNGRFSGPWRPFDTKLALQESIFRGAGREIGPRACNAWFYMKN